MILSKINEKMGSRRVEGKGEGKKEVVKRPGEGD